MRRPGIPLAPRTGRFDRGGSTAWAIVGIATVLLSGVAAAAEPPPAPTPGLAMSEPRFGHTATLLRDGSVLITGGITATGPASSAEVFDPEARSFEPTAPLRDVRWMHTATALPDGQVLILGGVDQQQGWLAAAELYDPLEGTFVPAGRLRKARAGHTATLLDDGRVLVIGGTDARARPVRAVEIYDPATQRSERIGRFPDARVDHTATLLRDGTVLVSGGIAYGRDGQKVFAAARLIDPASGRFTSVGPLTHARWLHAATRLEDGTVLVTGGLGRNLEPLGPVELYDPVRRRFSLVADLAGPMSANSSTLLDDGRVLVAGSDGEGLASLEVFDPTTASFTPAGSLHSPAIGHRATRLEDGTVLVTGGRDSAWPIATAELFDPASMRIVAFGPVDRDAAGAASTPSAAPLPPLGAVRGGGRIELPGSGFEMTFPQDWSVDVADPDPDVFAAAAGDAWEALRAHDPGQQQACSVSVGVATVSLRKRSGGASSGVTLEPHWDERDDSTLWVPEPRVDSGGGVYSVMSPRTRSHSGESGLEHDVLYVVSCSASSDGESEALEEALDAIVETFDLLPAADPGPTP